MGDPVRRDVARNCVAPYSCEKMDDGVAATTIATCLTMFVTRGETRALLLERLDKSRVRIMSQCHGYR